MKIRKLTENDLEALIHLHEQFWGEVSDIEKVKAKYQKLSNNENYILLCAEIESKIVGSVMGVLCEELYGNCKPFLVMENLITDKNYRKQGIGKALILELEKIAKSYNCTQMIFITETNRVEAISFYESLGFNSKSHVGFKKSLKNS